MVQFYKDFGVGKLGLHKAFRIERDENGKAQIVPITRIAHVRLDDLVGYEIAETETDREYRGICTRTEKQTTVCCLVMQVQENLPASRES